MHTRSFLKKTLVGIVGFLTIVTVAFTPTQQAHAQLVVSAPILEGITIEDDIWDRVWTNLQDFLLQAGTVGLVNLVQGFGQQLAAKSAEFIVTGDWGQQPLVFTQDWGQYLEDTASGALGEILMSFGEGISVGLKGASVTVKFYMEVGQAQTGKPPLAQVQKLFASGDSSGANQDPLGKVGVVEDGKDQYKFYFEPFKGDTPEARQLLLDRVRRLPYVQNAEIANVQAGGGSQGSFGLNLCSPQAPELLYAIPATLFGQLGGQGAGGDGSDGGATAVGVAQPRCDFKTVYNSWEQWAEEQDPTAFFGNFRAVFDFNQNDLSIANGAFFEAGFGQIAAQRKAELERSASNTYRDLKSQISGNVLTPKDNVEEAAEIAGPKAQKDAQDATFNAFVASGESIVAAIAGTFLSTLSQKLMEKYFSSGAIPDAGVGETIASDSLYSVGSGRTSAFKAIYADVYTPKVREVNNYNILAEFQACPDRYPQQNNCVIDSDFANAVRRADSGDSMTVREAIENGMLHGDWYLLPPDDSRNSQKSCWSEAYCYSNLVKLRRARIIPLGWEIAAQESKGTPITLGEAVRKFDDCNYTEDPNGVADSAHPYCHLVDPNWILKAPPMQCRAKVYSAVLQSSEAPLRQETCVDDPTCVATDENGKCLGAWGYCTREQNAWRFEGTRCEAQYESCLTMRPREGGSVSYLTSTLNNNYCNDKNIGCRAYATSKDVNGVWNTAGKQVFFNKDVATCSQKAAGCTRLQNSNLSDVYLRVAPAGLNCTGNTATDVAACGQYARTCRQDELGCSLYSPTNGDPSVPAIAGAGNVCDKSCAGYAQYVQQGTQLEPAEAASLVAYFIPSTAQQCSAAQAGCTGFTNVDAQSAGGEAVSYFTSLRTCIKPSEAPNDTFYTWEGSDTTGYQLQAYQLKLESNAAYKTVNVESGALAPAYRGEIAGTSYMTQLLSKCTEALYKNRATDPNFNPDCREFLDSKGKRSYRLITEVVFASNECASLRRNDVVSQTVCSSTGGTVVEGGACVYRALPKESGRCTAAAVGCRGYAGSTAGAGRIVLQDSFESTVTTWQGATLSTESMAENGRSLKLDGVVTTPAFPTQSGKSYTISFWAKSTTPLRFGYTVNGGAVQQFSGAENTNLATTEIPADGVWRPYTFGPVFVAEGTNTYAFVITKGQSSGTAFIDNLYVKEADGIAYVVKDSWKTPQVCDANTMDKLPGAALGCREYKDQAGVASYLTGFSKVCRAESVGCGAFINTFNSQSPSAQVFNTGIDKDGKSHPEDDVAVQADEIQYLVNNSQFSCTAADVGCSEFGLPNKTGGIDTVYIKNNPDLYPAQMCKSIENRCDAYSSGSTTMYFKDPGSNTCTYQVGVIDDTGAKVDGWFKTVTATGAPEACDPTYIADGAYGIWKNGDTKYAGYAGVCPSSASACTAFVDRSDTSDKYPGGKPYYFLDNKGIDTTSCNGQVNLREGCILFDRTTDVNKQWSSSLTQAAMTGKEGVSLTPVRQTAQLPEAITVVVDGKTVTCDTQILGNTCKQVTNTQCTLDLTNAAVYQNSNKNTFGKNKSGLPAGAGKGGDIPASCTPFKDDPNCGKERLFCVAKMREMQVTVPLAVPEGGWDGVSAKAHEATFGALCTSKLVADVDSFCKQQIGYYTGSNWIYNYLTPDFLRTQLLCQAYVSGGSKVAEIIDLLTTLQLKARQACGVNDSNTVIKVSRDRVCGEWLACKTSFTIWNEQKGKWDDVCIDVGTCAEWKTGTDGKSAGECARWVDTTDTTDKILDKTLYTSRDVSWKGKEYSGYSIYNQFQAADLRPIVNAGGDGGVKDIPLGYVHPTLSSGACSGKADGSSCEFALPMQSGTTQVKGVCLKNYGCVVGKNGGTVGSGTAAQPNMIARTCRAYPESDAPFAGSIVAKYSASGEPLSKLANFQNANTCQRYDVNDGSAIVNADGEQIGTRDSSLNQCGGCSYQKAYFGQTAVRGQAKYYDLRAELPSGICQGGFTTNGESKDGKSCTRKSECADERPGVQPASGQTIDDTGKIDGLCLPLNRVQNVLGVEGYCLESDFSQTINGQQSQYACQTWHPATLMAGGTDIYNQYQEAGYVAPKNAGRYYCTQSQGSAWRLGAHERYAQDQSTQPASVKALKLNEYPEEYKNTSGDSYVNSEGYKLVVANIAQDTEHKAEGFIAAISATDAPAADVNELYDNAKKAYNPLEQSQILIKNQLYWSDIERAELYFTALSVSLNGSNYYNDMALKTPFPLYTNGKLFYTKYQSGSAGFPVASKLVNDTQYTNSKRLRFYWSNDNQHGYLTAVQNNDTAAISDILTTKISKAARAGALCSGDDRNRMFVDLVFDKKTDALLGVHYHFCDEGEGSGGFRFYLVLHLKEQCQVVDRVVNESGDSSGSKAWTNRVWASATKPFELLGSSIEQGAKGPAYTTASYVSPFGSALLSTAPTQPLYVVAQGAEGRVGGVSAGSPLMCPEGQTTSQPWSLIGANAFKKCAISVCIGGGDKHGKLCNVQSDCKPSKPVTLPDGSQVEDMGICSGIPRQADDYLKGTAPAIASVEAEYSRAPGLYFTSGLGLLKNLFAKSYEQYTWVPSKNAYNVVTGDDDSYTFVKNKKDASLRAPAVQAAICNQDGCSERPDGSVAVNNFRSGFIASTGEATAVQVRFYTNVSPNQMPIKRVAVAWGSEWGNAAPNVESFEGLYKNRRPVCDSKDFASSPEACSVGYYQFIHYYTFDSCVSDGGEIFTVGADGKTSLPAVTQGNATLTFDPLKKGYRIGDRFCAFQPRVQIMDNWGWCNGSCEGDGKGCYESNATQNLCSDLSSGAGLRSASTPFNGYVIVREVK